MVWQENRIFIKPLPSFLFTSKVWEEELNHEPELHKAAVGMLLSYAALVSRRSDFDIAMHYKLLPSDLTYEAWSTFITEILVYVDLRSLCQVSPRYHYGELRRSRLNQLHRLVTAGDAFMHGSTWYTAFFAQHFGWLLAVFAFFNVALSAMQVALQAGASGAFQGMAWWFAIVSLVVVLASLGSVAGVWFVLFWWHLLRTWFHWKGVMSRRMSWSMNSGSV